MEQGSLIYEVKKEEISDEIILGKESLTSILRFCIEISTLGLGDVAFQLGFKENQLSRMLTENPNDNYNFSPDLINKLMDICQNEIPLRWQALKRGYGLYQLKTTLEIENETLKALLEEQKKEMKIIKRWIKETKG